MYIFEEGDGIVYKGCKVFYVILLIVWFVVFFIVDVEYGVFCLCKVNFSFFYKNVVFYGVFWYIIDYLFVILRWLYFYKIDWKFVDWLELRGGIYK